MTVSRRGLLQAGLALGAWPALAAQAAPSSGWFMPDEHGPQASVTVAFGAKPAIWGAWTADVQNAVGRLARAMSAFQPVTVLCRASQLALAQEKCGLTNTRYVISPLDDIWVRDTGGLMVRQAQAQSLGTVDLNFNGWGRKQTHRQDAQVASTLSAAIQSHWMRSALVGEGGGIEVDGAGTAILCESSWVNPNRNPGWSRDDIEAELMWQLGLRKIIWLPGIRGKDITDAHVDFYARFVRPGVVIANLDNDPQSYDYALTRTHLQILQAATDADGRTLQIHTLPPPLKPRRNKFTTGNPDFAPGYVNFITLNGAVLLPEFGDREADRYAQDLLASLFPGRVLVPLNIDAIAGGGGGIHCVTLHVPAT